MKLKFQKNEKQEIKVIMHDGTEEKEFSYINMIKSLTENNIFEDTVFEEGITNKEKKRINVMLNQINQAVSEKDK